VTIQQLVRILRAHAGTLLMVAILVASLAAGVMTVLPKRYKATATVLVEPETRDSAGAAGGGPAGRAEEVVSTHSDILASTAVAQAVVEALGLEQRRDAPALLADPSLGSVVRRTARILFPAEEQAETEDLRVWMAGRLQRNLELKSNRDSRVIHVTYTAPDPQFAAAAANAFVEAYRQTVRDLNVRPVQEDSRLYDQQMAQLRQRLESAEAELTRFQQEKGIVASDERLDVETARLNELSGQLAVAQAQAVESAAKERRLREFLARPGAQPPAEIVGAPVVQQLQQRIAESEAEFSELARRRGPNHPQRRAAETKLQQLRAELGQAMQRMTHSLLASSQVGPEREAAARGAFERQRNRVLGLKSARDRLAALAREVEEARRAYLAASERLARSRIASEAGRANTSLVHGAVAPISPFGPSPMLVVALAFAGGLAIGIGVALAREASDGRIRCERDVLELGAPVLAVLLPRRVGGQKVRRLRGPNVYALPGG
jgi:chain length determinant protein EpsF